MTNDNWTHVSDKKRYGIGKCRNSPPVLAVHPWPFRSARFHKPRSIRHPPFPCAILSRTPKSYSTPALVSYVRHDVCVYIFIIIGRVRLSCRVLVEFVQIVVCSIKKPISSVVLFQRYSSTMIDQTFGDLLYRLILKLLSNRWF